MSGVKKYLRNGSISPLWQDIENQRIREEHEDERLLNLINNIQTLQQQAQPNYPKTVDQFVDKQVESVGDKSMVTIVKYPREVSNVYDELMSRFTFLEDVWDGEDGKATKIAKVVLETF